MVPFRSTALSSRGDPCSFTLDTLQHAAEDDVVERDDGVPIKQAEESTGLKESRLTECALARAVRFDLEFEHGLARKFHLGAKSEASVRGDASDAPEVESLAIAHLLGVAPPAAQSRTAHQDIDPAAHAPQPVSRIPSVTAANAANGSEHGPIGRGNPQFAPISKNLAAGPVWVSGDGAGH
jgi:hypothetical protein